MVRKSSKSKESSSDWPPRPLPISLSASRLPASLKNLKAYHLLNQNQNPINNSLKYLKLTPLNSSKNSQSPLVVSPPAEKEILIADSGKTQENYLPVFKRRVSRCACSTCKGQIGGILKEHNQDSILLIAKVNNVPYQFLFGVFDGHGEYGHSISSLIKSRIKSTTSALKASTESSDLTSYIETTISLVSQTVISSPIESKDSGSTLNLVLISGNKLVCGNVGDSRCVIGKLVGNEWKADTVSTDHKPSDKDEFQRVTKAGGIIDTDLFGNCQGSILRVWSHNPKAPGLAMTRSIGDKRMAKVGVTSEPDIFERDLSVEDKLVIIATDGLWDVVNTIEAVLIAGKCIKTGHAKIMSQTLVDIAKQRWTEKGDSIDDISVIVVLLNSKID